MPFHTVDFGSKKIKFKLQFSDRKTLGISVLPDLSVIATAPSPTVNDIEKIKSKIIKRAPWILRQQSKFAKFLPRTSTRKYVSGESYRYLGRQLRLRVIEGFADDIRLKDGYLLVTVDDRNTAKIEASVEKWFKERAKTFFGKKLVEMAKLLGRYDIGTPRFQLRQMTMRWGSCGRSGLIYVNPELVKTPSSCIEYVLVHELCHLVHPKHDKKFYALLTRIMPDWKRRKARLESFDIG
jgi:predicted metal-dependent hydrolase